MNLVNIPEYSKSVCQQFEAFHFKYVAQTKEDAIWGLLKVHSEGHGYR